ncbi:unnamed protein product [Amoebophrya sp. A25]|nr:unnamed protein product [Amoebophrya sp. A25]|eukprot:GSA25T00015570001.1
MSTAVSPRSREVNNGESDGQGGDGGHFRTQEHHGASSAFVHHQD